MLAKEATYFDVFYMQYIERQAVPHWKRSAVSYETLPIALSEMQ